MADKAISDLTQATQITGEDLFVLEQGGEAKKLKGSQVVQYAKDSVAAEVQGVKKYADNAKASANAAAASAEKAAGAAQGIDDKVSAADASAKAAASSAAAAAASATGVDEKVQAAQTAATNASKSETAAKNAQTAAANAQKAAESAQTGAQAAKTAAESAQEAAESAKDAAAGSSTSAGKKATQAAQSAEDAASAKSAAETAKTDAQAARDAIVNMIVEAVTLETGKPATVSKSLVDNVYKLVFGLPRGGTGAQGPQGATGNGISGIKLKSGTHAPGTSDVYTITLTDGTTFDFEVYNGANGQGAGDMLASVYDPQNKHQDIFAYVDNAIKDVKVTTDATPTQGSTNPVQSGGVYSALANKLDKTGDGSNVTAAFTAATTRSNIATGEKLSVLFGKIAKWFGDLGSLAFKSTVAKSDLASDVQTSLGKADSALQSAPVTSVNGATGEVKGTFYVTVTQGDNYSVTADKTAEEVYKAYAAGYAVYAITKFPGMDVPFVLPLVSAVGMRDMILLGFAALGSLSSIAAPNYPVVAYNGANRKWTAWIGTLARASDIPTIPTALKNPNALNIKIGDTTTSYDGSAAKTVKIPEGWPTMRKVTLPVTGWNSSTKQQSVTVTGVLADGTKQRVICSPVDESYDSAWNSCYVQCVGHGADSLTFQCDEIPTAAIEVYVSIQPVSFAS